MIYIVSFPRSGHHGFMGFLDTVAGVGEDYCEFYNCTKHSGERIPCCYEGLNWKKKNFQCGAGKGLMKCHDFDLSLPYVKENRYIVQYRHPFYSIESWYKYSIESWYKMETGKGKDLTSWECFFENKLTFWRHFIEKWVVDNEDKDNVFLVPYHRLEEPKFIEEVCDFLQLTNVEINNLGEDYFRPKRKLPEDDGFFSEKEVEIKHLLEKANIQTEYIK